MNMAIKPSVDSKQLLVETYLENYIAAHQYNQA